MQLDHILLRSTPTGTNQDTSIFERLVTTTTVTAEAFWGMSLITAVAGAAAGQPGQGCRPAGPFETCQKCNPERGFKLITSEVRYNNRSREAATFPSSNIICRINQSSKRRSVYFRNFY